MEKWTKEQIDTAKKYLHDGCTGGCSGCCFHTVFDWYCYLRNALGFSPAPEAATGKDYHTAFQALISQHEHDADIAEADVSDTQKRIIAILDAVKGLLLYKNRLYGDSALHPAGIFYKGDASDSICMRIDDKLNRIKNNPENPRINDVLDSLGYHVLYLAKRMDCEDVLAAIEKEKD